MIARALAPNDRQRIRGRTTLCGRARESRGHTLPELMAVLAILGIVLGSLTGIFLSGTKAQLNMTKRFDAQSNARLALDALRREIHCANKVTTNGTTQVVPADFTPARSSITIALAAPCPTAPVGGGNVTWCTLASGPDFTLWRKAGNTCSAVGALQKANHLTTGAVFTAYGASGGGVLAKLTVRLPVDADPNVVGGLYTLEDDIVLRNTPRT